MRRENGEVDKRFDQEGSLNFGKVIYSERNLGVYSMGLVSFFPPSYVAL